MWKRIIFLLLLLLAALIVTPFLHAAECDGNFSGKSQNELNQIIDICTAKLSNLRQQRNTLASQIQYMDTQIYLTQLQIQDTEQKIVNTQKEIELLTGRIEGLDTSLDYLSKLMINRVINGYKNQNVTIFDVLLNSQNAGDLINKLKYYKTIERNNQKVLIQVQEAKLNFEEQKQLREEKKVELNNLTRSLEAQKNSLNQQKVQKQQLLAETQNSESVFQSLLEKARRELAGFSAFTRSIGGGLTSFGNGSNGWYFTQRDPQWGNMTLPGSSSSVLLAGCAVTSVAMVCKSYGQGITPESLVSDDSRFNYGDLWNWAFSCDGKSTTWLNSPSLEDVKSYVNQNIPVILRLYAPSVSGLHFIVAWKWDGSDLIIHDPYYGPDKKFNDLYNWSQVTRGIAIR